MPPKKAAAKPVAAAAKPAAAAKVAKAKTTAAKATSINPEDAAAAKYQKMTQREHILNRASMYLGSLSTDALDTWIWDGQQMVKKTIAYNAAFIKTVLELTTNCIDHCQRLKATPDLPQTRRIDIIIDKETGTIEITNDGAGIDCVFIEEHQVYAPELIFGHFLTSTNYDDNAERLIAGLNGIGSKAANVFSKQFTIETIDPIRKKSFQMTWNDNMTSNTPALIKACTKKPYTRVSYLPDYERFGLPGMTDDHFGLLAKCAYDVAALTPPDVKVFFNGEQLPVKTFEGYANLFLGSKGDHKRVYQESDRWQVVVSTSPFENPSFECLSFVNGTATLKGGKHVDYIVNQVVKSIIEAAQKKAKNAQFKPAFVRENLMVFINATINQPQFDSQSKEYLTTPVSKFGSKFEVDDKLITKLLSAEFMNRLLSSSNAESSKLLKKTDGKKTNRIHGIVELEDANWAGTEKSHECVLTLTEGASAKASAMAGISVVGRDRYGVFPLRGKLLNVREVTDKRISDNAEIAAIKKILGLESGKIYDNVNQLRYGKILIMADQDGDGMHIRALIMNMLQTLWPSLINLNGFVCSLLTPIVKVSRGDQIIPFYCLPDFHTWQEAQSSLRGWNIKYYKGLGTSTAKEAKEYFRDMKDVRYIADESTPEVLDLAFNKKRADDRKAWIQNYDRNVVLDYNVREIPYSDFVNTELAAYSVYNVERSIPSVVDGLKTSLRKIVFCAFKRNLTSEIKVAQFAGYVSEHGAYHHGEASLQEAIIGLAQNFVGANNINLFRPNGQFGTRLEGGKDAASPRYIFTELEPITLAMFHPEDRPLLAYREDDGQSVEPDYYIPILPTLLINGSTGIGTGFSTSIPCYHPLELAGCVRVLIDAEEASAGGHATATLPDLVPWYQDFKGEILRETDTKYASRGIFKRTAANTIEILELPVGTWTTDYKAMLEEMLQRPQFLKDYECQYSDRDVRFVLHFYPGVVDTLLTVTDSGLTILETEFKLVSSKGLHTGNMYAFDAEGRIHLYKTADDILRAYFAVRWRAYTDRKALLVSKWERELMMISAKVRFIMEIIRKELVIFDLPKARVEALLDERDYPRIDDSFDYLTRMPIYTLTLERKEELLRDEAQTAARLAALRDTSVGDMWKADLAAFEAAYDAFLKRREEDRAAEAGEDAPKETGRAGARKSRAKKK